MKRRGRLQLIGGLLDLPILDREYRYCGIVDDIELADDGDGLAVKALLVGPGAWRGRMPRWAYAIARRIAGERLVRVPWQRVLEIGSSAVLDWRGDELDLHRNEHRWRRLLPRVGAL